MKLYGALLSPFVRKVALAAQEKGMDYALIPFRTRDGLDPGFVAASPFLKIPAIDDDGYLLADSTAIVSYLEAKQPSPALIPADAKLRGKVMWFDEFVDTIHCEAGLKILFHRLVGPKMLKIAGDEAIALQGEAAMPRIRDYLESVMPDDGWLVGEFTLADISVASVLRTLTAVGFGPSDDYPKTQGWYERVCARPAWQAVAAIEDAPPK